jgi:DNA polymerase II large subunit
VLYSIFDDYTLQISDPDEPFEGMVEIINSSRLLQPDGARTKHLSFQVMTSELENCKFETLASAPVIEVQKLSDRVYEPSQRHVVGKYPQKCGRFEIDA